MRTVTFELPDALRIRVDRAGASFNAYLPELPAHVRFVFPSQAGRKLLEAFELDFLDAALQVSGKFAANNSFIVNEWRTLSLDHFHQSPKEHRMKIRYVLGDATRPQGEGAKIIVHCCNTVGAWGRGFVLALSRRWTLPERAYRAWHRNRQFTSVINHRGKAISVPMNFALGELLVVQVEPELFVANLIGQEGIRHNPQGKPPVRYEAIRQGLKHLRFYATELDASVHMPRIGAGLAGGRWSIIEAIICDELIAHGVSVTVYDLTDS